MLSQATARCSPLRLSELPKTDARPFPVGFAEFPRTVLPARDGVPHGGVKRSAPAPNCFFFTAWTRPEDRMAWEIEVHTAGRYEALIHYTCPKADVGSMVELTLGNPLGPARWAGTIAEAHDPPLRGKEQDRVLRLPPPVPRSRRAAGREGHPDLRATKVAGAQVADVRAVELVLLK